MRMSRIRRPHTLIFAAWTVQLAAWLLPALNVLGFLLPGWQTFFVTLSVFWPSKDGAWYDPLLLGLSAVTTLIFVVGSPLVVFRGSSSVQRTAAWVAAAAFLFNAHWCVFGELEWSEFRIGYFLWLLSFAMLALGLFDLARQNTAGVIHPPADLLQRTS